MSCMHKEMLLYDGDVPSRSHSLQEVQKENEEHAPGLRLLFSMKLQFNRLDAIIIRIFSLAQYIQVTAPDGDGCIRGAAAAYLHPFVSSCSLQEVAGEVQVDTERERGDGGGVLYSSQQEALPFIAKIVSAHPEMRQVGAPGQD
mmetsp:Transcript_20966/g.69945  ORF Transcript_20966/g.69945 Transcript_20966/m.69945 type:complete len:144 (+) Transcript_20966:151-582(+)